MDRTLSYATAIGLALMLITASTQALGQKPAAPATASAASPHG